MSKAWTGRARRRSCRDGRRHRRRAGARGAGPRRLHRAGTSLPTAIGHGWWRCSPRPRPARSGRIRGHRHTMLDNSDISSTRHARAFVAGALAGLVGHTEIFVSGGAEHQGPDGGGPVAIIATPRGGRSMSAALDTTADRAGASPRHRPRNHRHDQDLRIAGGARRRLDQGPAPARSTRCSARTAPASRRWSNASWASTSRPAARCWSTATRSRSTIRATPMPTASAWSTSTSRWCRR